LGEAIAPFTVVAAAIVVATVAIGRTSAIRRH